MTKNILIIFLVLLNIVIFGLFKYGYLSGDDLKIVDSNIKNDSNVDDNSNEPIVPSLSLQEEVTFQDALLEEAPVETSFLKVNNLNNINVFDDFYSKFKSLEKYEDYKKYSEKYPSLLPLIYAVKLKDKEGYMKLYGFIFDRVEEEKIYFKDIENLVGEYSSRDDLKGKFLNILGKHYDNIAGGSFYFNGSFGDGPEHITLSADEIDTVIKNCDASKISSLDSTTKEECYNYGYHYRATTENKFCDKIIGEYQKSICTSFLLRESIKD